MQEIKDKSIDMILCDMPYGTTKCKWDIVIDLDKMWKQYKRIIKEGGAIALFSAEPFTSILVTSNLKMFKYDLIWEKNQPTDFLNANRKPMRIHENILIFCKKTPVYNKQITEYKKPYKARRSNKQTTVYDSFKTGFATDNVTGGRNPTTIIKCKREFGLHPTQKPVKLLEYLIKTYSNEGDTILDNCMGSGSTGVACINTNRKFIGMELDENYFNIAKERIDKAYCKISIFK